MTRGFPLLNRMQYFLQILQEAIFVPSSFVYWRYQRLVMFAHQVVAGLNRNDLKAREWVYHYYYDDVLHAARVASSGSPDVQDLVSETFLRLYDHSEPFDSIRSIQQFLFSTARNLALDRRKHQDVVDRRAGDVEKYYQDLEEAQINKDALYDAFDEMMEIAAKKLSPQCRQVIILCYTYGEKNADIGRRLGISEKTVEYHKTTAYKKLKLEMEKRNRGYFLNFLL
jgi:RNA polymerase sigma factor (sigma-70 family)